MTWTRNRGSKRLRARSADGRFKRASLRDLGWTACSQCGRFHEIWTMDDSGPFPDRRRVEACPHCGAACGRAE